MKRKKRKNQSLNEIEICLQTAMGSSSKYLKLLSKIRMVILALLLRVCRRQTLSCLCRFGGSAAKWAAERCQAKLAADGL